MKVRLLFFFFALIAASRTAAARLLTVDDVVALRRITAVQLSPDGSRIAYIVEQPSDELHSKVPPTSELWIYTVKDSTTLPLEDGNRPWSPKWSPDSGRLAFLSSTADGSQVFLMNPTTRTSSRATKHPGGIDSFAWSRDGSTIVFISKPSPSEHEKRRADQGYDEIHVGPGPDQAGRGEQLWTFSVSDGREQQVDTRAAHLLAYDLSPNGRTFLLATAATPWADDEALRPQLVTMDAAGGATHSYCQVEGRFMSPTWSPDNSSVAYLGTSAGAIDPYPGGLYICNATGVPRNLIANSDFSVEQYRWTENAKAMIVVAARGAHRSIARLQADSGRLTPLTKPPLEVAFRSPYSVENNQIACVLATSKTPPDVWLIDRNGKAKQISHVNPQVDGIQFADGEEFDWTARDGSHLTGVLLRPIGYRAGVRYPLVVQVHGSQVGDMNEFQATWMNWGQLLAANGYALLLPNYRGSLTSGAAFARADQGDLGGKDLTDILDGADALVAAGIADPDRMGIGGVSYGGFLTALAITQTTRFKAAVVGLGISNWIAIAGQTPGPESMVALYWKHSPYDRWQILWNRSPVAYAKNVRTPALIYAGENDPIIPASQSRELLRALQHYKVPSEFILYPREGHSVMEPNHLRDNLTRILEWYNRYLGN
jgi:dipeptidyl aminopeptidase/acylaminoacyl peptidase